MNEEDYSKEFNEWEKSRSEESAARLADRFEETDASNKEVYEAEVRTFERENWHFAFYSDPGDPMLPEQNPDNPKIRKFFEGEITTRPEGDMRTYVCTEHTEPGTFTVPYFFKLGNVTPPAEAWGRKLVVKVIEGELTVIENVASNNTGA